MIHNYKTIIHVHGMDAFLSLLVSIICPISIQRHLHIISVWDRWDANEKTTDEGRDTACRVGTVRW